MKSMIVFVKRVVLRSSTLGMGILALAAIGCGGGGGDDGGDDVPSICRSYCSFWCARSSDCGFFPASEVDDCDDACVRTVAANGATAAQCDRGGQEVAAATCSQIGSILGVTQRAAKNQSVVDEPSNMASFVEHCGTEFGVQVAKKQE